MIMSDGGYPLEWFSEPLDSTLKCGICTKVLRDPSVTPCGHVYCSYCLIAWLNSYGVCPQRCEEVEVESLRRRVQLDTFISGLFTYCKNKRAGCTEQVPLIEKHLHENICPHRSTSVNRANSSGSSKCELKPRRGKHKRTSSSVSASSTFAISASLTAAKRSPSVANLYKTKDSSVSATAAPVSDMNSKGIYSTHTFRLKRTKAREPLGLVLVSGEKTHDGRPKSFYVKKVHADTLGWKAGVQANDRIVQVDFHDLASIDPTEAVARIKERTLVTLTVIRGLEPYPHKGQDNDDHVYDEIYSDGQLSQNLSQSLSHLDENTPISNDCTMSSGYPLTKNKSGRGPASAMFEDKSQRSRSQKLLLPQQLSPLSIRSVHLHKDKQSSCRPCKFPRAGGSKDSGLSSGSSTHQDNDEPHQGRHMFAPSPPVGDSPPHHFRRTPSGGSAGSEQHNSNFHSRIEGEYEIEDIYLRKNGTSQLGITLGYNMENKTGLLYVCEVVPNGLAAQNGRIKSGDIIQKVNGFEVHDTEEAILLFLEQNQDITLTVARPTKASSRPKETPPPPRSTHLPPNDLAHHDYAVLETTRVMATTFRRVDSCGTLDSTCNHPPVLPLENLDIVAKNAFRRVDSCGTLDNKSNRQIPATNVEDMDAGADQQMSSNDLMRRTRSTGSAPRNAKVRDGHLNKSKTPPAPPPALGRRTSPLISQQQPQEQQPIYHVLQQPPSPVYQVLQQPLLSPSNTHFQHEKKFTFSEQATSKNSTLPRPASAGPHSRYRINSSITREGHADHTHSSATTPTSRSTPTDISLLRSEVIVADFSPESLV